MLTSAQVAQKWGFNGAVDLNPRKPIYLYPIVRPVTCFNGAVDLNPRKLPLAGGEATEAHCGFNGAVDLNPRKQRAGFEIACQVEQLQWGRGFESTETMRGRGTTRKRTELQWGRGFESTETPGGLGPRRLEEQASMGPWI